MKAFELTKIGKEDLRSIARYTEKHWGVTQRNLYIKQFDDSFHFLADSPDAGKECGDIKKGYRKFPQGSHIIFYTQATTVKVQIIRILHKSMDIESKFGDT